MALRGILLRLTVIGAAVLLASCSDPDSQSSRPVRIAVVDPNPSAEPSDKALEPIIARETQAGLLSFGPDGQVAPALARSWNISEDGRQYLFRLRPDLLWTDDTDLDAEEVAQALDRARRRHREGELGPLVESLEEISSPAPGVVEITLARPVPSLLQLLALPEMAVTERKRSAVAPFLRLIPEAVPARLVADRRWRWPGAVPAGAVLVPLGADQAIARYLQQRVDVVVGPGMTGLLTARETGQGRAGLRIEPAGGYLAITFGSELGQLADDRLRAALSLSIDRDGLARLLFVNPLVQAQQSLVPPTLAGAGGQVVPGWADLPIDARRRAAEILARDAEVAPDRPLTLTIDAVDSRESAALLKVLNESWAPLGITLRARLRSPEQHDAFLAKGKFQFALVERVPPVPSAILFLEPLRCSTLNAAVCSAEADSLWDRYLETGEPAARTAAEQQWLSRTPIIPLVSAVQWSFVHPSVSGWTDNAIGAHPLSSLSVPAAPRS